MTNIFRINEELASIAVTSTEILSITRGYLSTVSNPEFIVLYKGIISEINKSYDIVTKSLAPFYALDSHEQFNEDFDTLYMDYRGHFLLDVSKPRQYCDNVYDDFIQLQHSKEVKSGFPALKRNYKRLYVFYDKWISNDNFLGLSIDGVLKQTNLLLAKVDEIKTKDDEDAWLIFQSAFDDFSAYLTLIVNQSNKIRKLVQQQEPKSRLIL